MNRTSKLLLRMLILGAVGGIIGGSLAVKRRPIAHSLHFPSAMIAAIVLICLFSIFWNRIAKSTAPTQSSESRWSRQFHLIVLNLGVLLLILPVPGLTRQILLATHLLQALGLLIESAGIAFAVWARRHLGTNWSGEVRIATGHQLVRSGPYQVIRHPIYTGVLAMYLGAMLVSAQIHPHCHGHHRPRLPPQTPSRRTNPQPKLRSRLGRLPPPLQGPPPAAFLTACGETWQL